MAYHQYEQGLITEDRLNNALGILIEHVRDNYFAQYAWNAGNQDSPFAAHVNKLFEERGGLENPCPDLIPNSR